MEHLMEEYGTVAIAVLCGALLLGMIFRMIRTDGSLYQYILLHCNGAV